MKASEIHEMSRRCLPNIRLGTVYRNLEMVRCGASLWRCASSLTEV
jgi:hypothetical protein